MNRQKNEKAIPKKTPGKNRRLRALVFLVLLSAAGTAGCKLIITFFGGGTELSSFPHDAHVEADIECLDCHGETAGGGLPSFPSREDCASCHDEKEDEALLARFFSGEKAKWVHAGRQSKEIIFDHARHAREGEKSCLRCHENVAESSSLSTSMKIGMDDCAACHRSEGRNVENCAVCHREIRKDSQPPSHGPSWELQHGARAESGGFSTADRCNLCHTEDSCADCHQNRKPRSHNNYWRGRGHGLLAGIDRDRCAVCHTRDTCDRCHSMTRPRSHTASYGSPLDRHCLSCHLPLTASESCTVCHIDSPGHDQAPGLPSNQTHQQASAADCRTCHISLPHPDNGQTCRFCHF